MSEKCEYERIMGYINCDDCKHKEICKDYQTKRAEKAEASLTAVKGELEKEEGIEQFYIEENATLKTDMEIIKQANEALQAENAKLKERLAGITEEKIMELIAINKGYSGMMCSEELAKAIVQLKEGK